MNTSRRDFLRTLGLGAAACLVAAPVVFKAAKNVVMHEREPNMWELAARRMHALICKHLATHNPYMQLFT
jgi:hypothetical protein